jgi:hypothetical protein
MYKYNCSFPITSLAGGSGREEDRTIASNGTKHGASFGLDVPPESAPEEVFGRNEANPLDCELLVVDETSMVDVTLMATVEHHDGHYRYAISSSTPQLDPSKNESLRSRSPQPPALVMT